MTLSSPPAGATASFLWVSCDHFLGLAQLADPPDEQVAEARETAHDQRHAHEVVKRTIKVLHFASPEKVVSVSLSTMKIIIHII